MVVVFPISIMDQELALKNATWFNELGGCKGHEVLFGYDKRCNPGTVDATGIELSRAFDKVYPLPFEAAIDGWPEGANYFFRVVTARLETKPNTPYLLWLEPDAIPLKKGWLDILEEEYKRAGKPFMGDRVQVEDIPLHMSGVGIYPLPLHAFAGEAYRAAEVAWDMAGKDQIVPQAHFTKLIEHAWRHPGFTNQHELTTQIRPEAVLFHASKDGSLIDLLRKQKGGDVPFHAASAVSGISQANALDQRNAAPTVQPAGAALTCDIFIRTYSGDYHWLDYCLQSIEKFCIGFRRIWIVSPSLAPPIALPANAEWKVMNDETPDGYLAQQITKCYADVFTDYYPNYILHVDSDVIFTQPVTPETFFTNDQVVWHYTPYASIETPWQPVTEKFIGLAVPYEFMRRFPLMVPRWLYPKLREFCHQRHGMVLCDYIKTQPPRAFSEFNALGAYAYGYHHDRFTWNDTLVALPEPVAKQFHSWGGITPEIKTEIENILRGTEATASNKAEPMPTTTKGSADSVPSQIKVLSNGIWVLKDDEISRWVEQEKRLDHDQNFLPKILPLIREGDTVIDVGAFIGDHTIAYAKAVGAEGWIDAFEPNPLAFQCLEHNMRDLEQVHVHELGCGDKREKVPLSGNNQNYGGAYVGEHMPIGTVQMIRLDDFLQDSVDFLKIDVEGYEMKVLYGAARTIVKHHPTIVIEVNREALRRQGATPDNIFRWLEEFGYSHEIMQENCSPDSPLYDIVCSYNKSPEVSTSESKGEGGLTRCTSQPPPVTLSPASVEYAVSSLQEIAARSSKDRWRVMVQLGKAGLTPKWKPKKKQRDKIRHEYSVLPDKAKDNPETAPESPRVTEGERAG